MPNIERIHSVGATYGTVTTKGNNDDTNDNDNNNNNDDDDNNDNDYNNNNNNNNNDNNNDDNNKNNNNNNNNHDGDDDDGDDDDDAAAAAAADDDGDGDDEMMTIKLMKNEIPCQYHGSSYYGSLPRWTIGGKVLTVPKKALSSKMDFDYLSHSSVEKMTENINVNFMFLKINSSRQSLNTNRIYTYIRDPLIQNWTDEKWNPTTEVVHPRKHVWLPGRPVVYTPDTKQQQQQYVIE